MNIYAISPDISLYEQRNDKQGKIVSVFIGNGNNIVENFRCINCGRITFQYSGNIDSIYLGAKIINEPILDVLCHQCKIKYRIYG